MKTFLTITTLVVMVFANQANVTLNPSGLQRSQSSEFELNLSIDVTDQVMGIQFDLQYNPEELSFYGASLLLNDFMFEYRDKGNGSVRGLLFSTSGAVINPEQIADVISFDFSPVDGFTGESEVSFTDLILAGEHGVKIPAAAGSFVVDTDTLIPAETRLQTCYPNPFNPSTKVIYDLSNDGHVEIMVYDVMGRIITELVAEEQRAGRYEVIWNASSYSSGAYFIKMITPGYTATQKLMLIK